MARQPYPHARSEDVVEDHHGTPVADPYRWLEDPDAPDVRDWLTAQAALTRSWLDTVPGRDEILRRLRQLWDHPRTGLPWRRGQRWFQLRNTGLQDQDVLWTMDAADAVGRVLLDPNTLSADGTVSLRSTAASHDGQRIAYATSEAGSDWMTWRVRDVAAGTDHADLLPWSKFAGAAWTHGDAGFFYCTYPPPAEGAVHQQPNLAQRLRCHRLGTPQRDDRVVMAWPDEPEWGFDPWVSTDGRWLVVSVWRGTEPRNRLWLAPAEAAAEPEPLIDEFDASYTVAGTDGEVLYLLTDLDAPMGRIVAVDVRNPGRGHWREVVAEGSDRLSFARVVGGRLVTVSLHHASHRIRLFGLDGAPAGAVVLDGLASVGGLSGREDDRRFFFSTTGFTHSADIRCHDLDRGETTTITPPAVSVSGFLTEQVFVTSRDGTRVPLFLTRRADATPSGDAPTLLYGYGGFDASVSPSCSVSWLVWLERGGVLAVACLRGGGEYGKAWHDCGRLERKQNVFDDFIACAEWLTGRGEGASGSERRWAGISQGSDQAKAWTRPARLAINGGSNGGLLVGACMTQRPELFGACVPEVGVFDMLRFHKFTIGWAWVSDYGSPEDPDQFATLIAYSPLHNLRPGTAYPPTLVVTGDHDDRVVPGHSFKFAAALQAAQGGDAPVLLRVELSAGHGLGTPIGKLIEARADVLAFLERALDTGSGEC